MAMPDNLPRFPRGPYRYFKRVLDLTAATIGLAAMSPILASIAILIKLDSDGPVLFGHERIGLGGRKFKTWKFRTMAHSEANAGPQITSAGDTRVTRVGRILRKTKMDEVPQLLNVLIGDMSLVGPRPEVEEYVNLFADDYSLLLTVRPGITDEASIAFRNEEEILGNAVDAERTYREHIAPRKIRLYLSYLDEMSFSKDLSILFRTFFKIIHNHE
jgi:lipopolysaccharide/colanic/teichoic acid biosynthesis glycosyltransferase